MPSELAAQRGEPSYVWRAGQERRLQMVAKWTQLADSRILVDGCGVGMYSTTFIQRYNAKVDAIDIELERVADARESGTLSAVVSAAEYLPYPADAFDLVFSHEVIEHVADDRAAAAEMVRVTRPGGRIIIFCPNRWYPFETHGHYWRGQYHFGNTPFINYLPDTWRNKLAPHVRAYTKRSLRGLFRGQPVKVVHHSRIYGGYDNIIARLGTPGKFIRDTLYRFEGTPLDTYGLSHFLVIEKTAR
ncbi:MAG: class I SAM-dependent methyltransferase [Chloroflexi bacterium]|nr:class I SAM-dependent methyltransferase [Chloroflexota bacterium]